MPKVIVHIGLPKTATTSLQIDIFSKIEYAENMHYLGVFHPRESFQEPLFKQFYHFIRTGKGFEDLKNKINNKLQEGKNILISEEMIVVSDPDIEWRQKLKNLAILLKQFEHKIIVTVREPVSALFSYYTENIEAYKKNKGNFKEIALTHESMKIFHYKFFFGYLHLLFPDGPFCVLEFEKIIQNEYSQLFNFLELSNKISITKLKTHNTKVKTKDRIIKKKEMRMAKYIFDLLPSSIAHHISSILNKNSYLKNIFSSFLDMKYVKSESVKIPDQGVMDELRQMLKEETKYLEKYYGINYLN